jgi:hypothetical protein
MDTIKKRILLNDLASFGYPLLEQSGTEDPATTLSELIKTGDIRLLEGFPIVLTTCLQNKELSSRFDLDILEKQLPSATLRKRFRLLLAVTLYLLALIPESAQSKFKLASYLRGQEPGLSEKIAESFQKRVDINIGSIKLSPDRLIKTFTNYIVNSQIKKEESLARQLERERDQTLREALNQIFSIKQVDIIEKIIGGKPLTKTEREYYSRVIKHRLKAIANRDLQTLASNILAGK